MEWFVSRDTHVSWFVIKAPPPYMASLFLCHHPNYIRSWPVTIKKQVKYSYGGHPGYDTLSYSHKLVTSFRRNTLPPYLFLHWRWKPHMPSKILSPPTTQNYGVYGSCPKGRSQIFVYVYILSGYLPNIQLKFHFLYVFTVSVLKSSLVLQRLSI